MSTALAAHKVVIIVPGLPLFSGTRDVAKLTRRSTRSVRDVLKGGGSLPVRAHDSVVGTAITMDYVEVDGEPALLFRAVLSRPATEFRRRLDGALVGGLRATGWVTGIFPTAIFVEVAQ